MKIRPLCNHLKPKKWYNDLFDKIVKKDAGWWEEKSFLPDKIKGHRYFYFQEIKERLKNG